MYNQPITQRAKGAGSIKPTCNKCGKKECTCSKSDCGCGK